MGPEWESRCCSVECWPEPLPLENPEENQAGLTELRRQGLRKSDCQTLFPMTSTLGIKGF